MFQAWRRWRDRKTLRDHAIPDALWTMVLERYPFLPGQGEAGSRLRDLSTLMLASKEFTGANGLSVTDEMAVCIVAQACLPVLNLGLHWYDDFVGIVVQPDEVIAQREQIDELGVVHAWDEVLSGEAMEGGPVMLSWPDVAASGATAEAGYNVVIHEFVHKLDMRDGRSDGCPPLKSSQHRLHWLEVMTSEFERFAEASGRAQRFPGLVSEPWLDSYAAQSIDEFFAVTAEAYFVAPQSFAGQYPALVKLYDDFFSPGATRS